MSWSETDMLEIFGRRYEYLSQKEFDAARKSHRVDFGGCLFENVTLDGLRIAGGDYDFSGCRFLDCTISNSYLDGVLFEGTTFEDCLFENVEALRASFTNARVFHSRMCNIVFHDFDAQGSSWRHGTMRDSILGNANLQFDLLNSFTFHQVRVQKGVGLNADAITMGGATQSEVSQYRDSVVRALSDERSLSLFDELGDSKQRIWSEIFYVPFDRVSELSEMFNGETNEPEAEEWRKDLTTNERCLVDRWDKDVDAGFSKLAEALSAARQNTSSQPQSSTLESLCARATEQAATINAVNPSLRERGETELDTI